MTSIFLTPKISITPNLLIDLTFVSHKNYILVEKN